MKVFGKINIDVCGPQSLTTEGYRYILMEICMESKYPEAIIMTDISSVKVNKEYL